MREGYLEGKAEEKRPRQSRVQKIGYDYGHKEAFLGEERARVRRAISGTLRRSASVLFFFCSYWYSIQSPDGVCYHYCPRLILLYPISAPPKNKR